MLFLLKYLIVGALAYIAYRRLDKRFAVTEEFEASVLSKFATKNGKNINQDDDSLLDVKDVWKYFLVLKEDAFVMPDSVVGEVSPEDVSTDVNLTEEVSQSLYDTITSGDKVKVKVSYSRWTKKLLNTEVVPSFKVEGEE